MRIIILFLALLTIPALAQDDSGSWTEEHWSENSAAPGSVDQAMPEMVDLNISGQEPESIILAEGNVSYSNYISSPRSNELWIVSNKTWDRYSQVTQGKELELVAYVAFGSSAGSTWTAGSAGTLSTADLYRVFYTNSIVSHKSYDVAPGYYSLKMNAQVLGRTMLFLSVDNQPSNVVMIDVIAAPEESGFRGAQAPLDLGRYSPADARVTIVSSWLSGYSVFVDGVPLSSDKADGSVDGIAGFAISGDMTHTIAVVGGGSFGVQPFRKEYTRNFKSSYDYTLKI